MAAPVEIRDALVARWPGAALPDDALAALAAAAGDAQVGPHRDDLLLAWACLGGAPAAIAALDATMLVPAGGHARRRGAAAELVDDALQLARVRLLLDDAARPAGLRGYRGRGPLAAFVRTVVTRVVLDLQRGAREPPVDVLDAVLADAARDPELELVRRQHARALGDALRDAWGRLAAHDRFLLGLLLHDRLDAGAIARIYAIHRATAVRRAASARAALLALTRDALRARLGAGDATIDSLLRIVTTSVAWTALDQLPRDHVHSSTVPSSVNEHAQLATLQRAESPGDDGSDATARHTSAGSSTRT